MPHRRSRDHSTGHREAVEKRHRSAEVSSFRGTLRGADRGLPFSARKARPSPTIQSGSAHARTQRMTADSTVSDGRQRGLSDAMRAFAEATIDYQRLLRTVAERMARLLGHGCVIALSSEDEQQLIP